jgi:hypothetical protein
VTNGKGYSAVKECHEILAVFWVEGNSPAHAEAKVRAILHEARVARIEYVVVRRLKDAAFVLRRRKAAAEVLRRKEAASG